MNLDDTFYLYRVEVKAGPDAEWESGSRADTFRGACMAKKWHEERPGVKARIVGLLSVRVVLTDELVERCEKGSEVTPREAVMCYHKWLCSIREMQEHKALSQAAKVLGELTTDDMSVFLGPWTSVKINTANMVNQHIVADLHGKTDPHLIESMTRLRGAAFVEACAQAARMIEEATR